MKQLAINPNSTNNRWNSLKQTLKLMNQPRHLHPLFIVFIAIISFSMGFSYTKDPKIKEVPVVKFKEVPVKVFEENKKDKFTEKKLREYLKQLNVQYIDIVIAQAKLESDYFRSNIFLTNHNLFGMKPAIFRSTTSRGVFSEHAVYKDWRESVLDYAMMQNTIIHKCKNKKQYIAYLQQNYSKTPTYMKRVRRILKESHE